MTDIREILARLPSFYDIEENSLIYNLIYVFSSELDNFDKNCIALLQSRWLDFANLDDLKNIAHLFKLNLDGESDVEVARSKLKKYIETLKSEESSKTQLENLLKEFLKLPVEIVEHPVIEAVHEEQINITTSILKINNYSVEESYPRIQFDATNYIQNISFINLRNSESITYHGRLVPGDSLIIYPSKLAELNLENVSSKITSTKNRTPAIYPGDNEIKVHYDAPVLDEMRLDNTFFINTDQPIGKTKIIWNRKSPAEFLIKIYIGGAQLTNSDEENIRAIVKMVKPAGVIYSIVTLQPEKGAAK